MKINNLLRALLSLVITANGFAAAPSAKIRTIENTSSLPADPLKQAVAPWFYKSLRRSPIEGWIIVRGAIQGGRVTDAKVVQSDLNGAYDQMALAIANNSEMRGFSTTGTHLSSHFVQVHLLIYQIKDGKMALAFMMADEPGGTQYFYYGSAWLAVFKDGKWTQVRSATENERRPGYN